MDRAVDSPMLFPLLFVLAACAPEPNTRTLIVERTVEAEVILPTDRDGDGHVDLAAGGTDCDDANAEVFPGATERCNGRDDDCDEAVDETFDLDGDGFLTAAASECAVLGQPLDCDDRAPGIFPGAPDPCDTIDQDCDGRDGTGRDDDADGVPHCDDCNDDDPLIFPGAPERCNGIDDDCNGLADETFDGDGDGVGACAGDCDDTDPTVHPSAAEVCDGKDNDCSGIVDDPFDTDGDGWATCRGDCDDTDPSAHPFAPDTCDGVDNDCDGWVDGAYDLDLDGISTCADPPDCDDGSSSVYPSAPELCDGLDNDCDGVLPPEEVDRDGDGVRLCGGDCDDGAPEVRPGRPEACDGRDSDCDPTTDEEVDGDGDGLSACENDCDDTDATVFPGAVERCNAVDDDCDGFVDEEVDCGGCALEVWRDSIYLYCTEYRSWEEAQSACRELGYDLVTLDDPDEEEHLYDQAMVLWAGVWWIGLNDREAEGVWAWSDGSPVAYMNWAPGEPNDYANEDCGQAFWSGVEWNDAWCDYAEPYICELRR